MTIGGLLVIASILPPLVSMGCMASQPDPQIKIREFVLRPLAKFESDSPVNCDSADLKQALDAARFLNLDAKTLERRQLSADLRLEIGDHALKRGCLDFAGEVYREVLSTFISLNYDAQRQRAEVGLKEVKAASSVVETAN